MHSQASVTGSMSSLFTCLYGFMRIGVAEGTFLHMSPNLTSDFGLEDASRRNIENNYIILKEIFFFVYGATVTHYTPQIILPPTRQPYVNITYAKPIPPPSNFSLPLGLQALISPIYATLLGMKAWAFQLALRVCGPQLLAYAAGFEVSSVPGVFSSLTKR